MSLQQQLVEDLKAAMKSRDSVRTDTLRLLRAQLKDTEIDKGGELTAEDELAVLSNAKRRKEAIALYQKSDRKDLLDKENLELEIISSYLPEQLSNDEITTVVSQIIADTGAAMKSDMGKVMGIAMKQLKGKADGKTVQQIVLKQLN